MNYKIIVRTLQGKNLTYTVKKYDITDGFVCFTDEKTGQKKRFHGSNCEIEECEVRVW